MHGIFAGYTRSVSGGKRMLSVGIKNLGTGLGLAYHFFPGMFFLEMQSLLKGLWYSYAFTLLGPSCSILIREDCQVSGNLEVARI